MEFPWKFHGIPMETPWNSHGISMEIPWTFHGFPMETPWLSMEFEWKSHGISMEFPWKFHGFSMEFPKIPMEFHALYGAERLQTLESKRCLGTSRTSEPTMVLRGKHASNHPKVSGGARGGFAKGVVCAPKVFPKAKKDHERGPQGTALSVDP